MATISLYILGRRALWNTKQGIIAVGWAGFSAALLFALCTTSVYFVLSPIQQQTAALRQEASQLGTQTKAKFPSTEKPLNPAEQLDAFYRFFPRQDTVSDWMAKLYDAAAQQNLALENGEYRLAHDRDGKLSRYDIVLPVKGSYLQVRKFIAQALADVPSLALDGITFSRQKIDDAFVDAQIRFTLYLGEE